MGQNEIETFFINLDHIQQVFDKPYSSSLLDQDKIQGTHKADKLPQINTITYKLKVLKQSKW